MRWRRRFQFTHPGKGATVAPVARGLLLLVSIHAPWKGCDYRRRGGVDDLARVSIHAPWKGCDRPEGGQTHHQSRFNSRTLERVRLNSFYSCYLCDRVSIHAPWKGCDVGVAESVKGISRFNSRTLERVRHRAEGLIPDSEKFQFTHPGKGATRV